MSLSSKIKSVKNLIQQESEQPAESCQNSWQEKFHSENLQEEIFLGERFSKLPTAGPCKCGCPLFWVSKYDRDGSSPICRACDPPELDVMVEEWLHVLSDPDEWEVWKK